MTAHASPVLDKRQAAAYLGVSRNWLAQHSAEIGPVRYGNRLRFRVADLQAYIDRHRETPPTEPEQPAPTSIRVARERRAETRISLLDGEPYEGVGR